MRRFYFISGIILLAGFVYFTSIVKTSFLTSFDYNSTVKIQDSIPKSLDVILSFFSLFGSFEILFIVLLFALLWRKKLASFVVLLIFLVTHVIEIFGKSLLNHPGPPFQFFRYDLPFLFPSSYVQPGSSYPSGHSMRIVFVSIMFIFLIQRSKRIDHSTKLLAKSLIVIFMIIMLITRVSLGEHWSTDVIGGSLLGAGFGLISLIFL